MRTASLATLLIFAVAGSASAQLRPKDPPPKPAGEMKFFRVTLTNKSDVTVLFEMKWDGRDAEKVTLEPGKKIVAEMKQPPAPKKPGLTVIFVPRPRAEKESLTLESGHIDPTTNNPGIIYDFVTEDTNLGVRVVLKPR